MQVHITGIPWYRRENFLRLRSIFEDGEKLHATYEEWLAAAEKSRELMEAGGVRVVCVDIDPDKFPKWCLANGMKLNAEARTRFASFMASEIATGGQSSSGIN